jgi:hypothetical protein
MSKKGGGRSQAQLDARSRSMNPQDVAGRAAIANQTAQAKPGAPAHQAVLENRSVQLNTSPPPAVKPAPKPISEGSSSSGSP